MSACPTHGCDLVGDVFRDVLWCPQCKLERERDDALRRAERAERALWEIFLLSGEDVSSYTAETCTEVGREAGFQEWRKCLDYTQVVQAVRQLRVDADMDSAASALVDAHARAMRALDRLSESVYEFPGAISSPVLEEYQGLAAAMNRLSTSIEAGPYVSDEEIEKAAERAEQFSAELDSRYERLTILYTNNADGWVTAQVAEFPEAISQAKAHALAALLDLFTRPPR